MSGGGFWDDGPPQGALGCAASGPVFGSLLVWITGELSTGVGLLFGMGIGGALSLLVMRQMWRRYSD